MWRYCESTPCAFSEDKWDTKEDTGKSMKHALYILRYVKRAAKAMSNSKKIPSPYLADIELRLSEGIN